MREQITSHTVFDSPSYQVTISQHEIIGSRPDKIHPEKNKGNHHHSADLGIRYQIINDRLGK
jgi:hypothetical protein